MALTTKLRIYDAFGLRSATIDKRVLALVIGVQGALCAYRAYDYWATGFYVSDEYGYYYDASRGAFYGLRWFFGWLNIILFQGLGIHSVSRFALILPFYLFVWSVLTTCAFYLIMKQLHFNEKTIALSLFSSLFLASYVLLSLGFLTEPVGLSLVMIATYFFVRFLNVEEGQTGRFLIYPLLSVLFFGVATGTREPYDIFLIGGYFIVPAIALKKRKILSGVRKHRRWLLIIASIFMFLGPGTLFLLYPYNHFNEIGLRALGIGQTVIQPVETSTTLATTTRSSTSITSYTTFVNSTTVITHNGTTTTSIFRVPSITVGTVSSIVTQTTPTVVQHNRLANIFVIFLGGLVLGWGPILFVVALVGLLVLIRKAILLRDPTLGFVMLLALLALGSYFVVSYIFSTDPNYFSSSNFSTIIRFSDTAIPGFFLFAPFAFALTERRRRVSLSIAAILIIFVVIAVPTYETYASSSLVAYTGANPFSIGYRTHAVQVRDFIAAHQQDGPFYIIGWPTGWDFTPGTDTLSNVKIFTPFSGSSIPYQSYDNFLADKWTSFYIYAPVNLDMNLVSDKAPYLIQFINPSDHAGNSTAPHPYTVVNRQVVLQRPDFALIRIQLAWN